MYFVIKDIKKMMKKKLKFIHLSTSERCCKMMMMLQDDDDDDGKK